MRGHYNGIAITPLLQSRCVELASDLVPDKVCLHLNSILGVENLTNKSQVYRLVSRYGSSSEIEEELQSTRKSEELETVVQPVGSSEEPEVIYAMFDGGLFLYDEGYKEVKIGRIFWGSQIEKAIQAADNESVVRKNRVHNSEYMMREGHYENFVTPFGKLIDAHRAQDEDAQLVFITDGATWMRQWIDQNHPHAVSILDFYHAYEHLCEFGNCAWSASKERSEKLEEWKGQLRNGELDKIIVQLETYRTDPSATVSKAAEKLLTYLKHNRHRMRYDDYRRKGYLIGSGAIESAVRSVAQQRCKLSGQRWGNGLQPVLNIRALYRSGKGGRMNKIINSHFNRAA